MPTDTDFFRDFPPGAYGLPTPGGERPTGGRNAELPSSPAGCQLEFGYPEADFSFAPNTFGVLVMSPQVAQAYLPTLTYVG